MHLFGHRKNAASYRFYGFSLNDQPAHKPADCRILHLKPQPFLTHRVPIGARVPVGEKHSTIPRVNLVNNSYKGFCVFPLRYVAKGNLPVFDSCVRTGAALIPFLCVLVLVGCGGSAPKTTLVTTPPAGPPVISSLSPTSGVVGASIAINGSNFGSAQSSSTVTLNGQSASVVKWTNSAILAKVPPGASSGTVVVMVGGTASNAVPFHVVALPGGSIALANFGFQCGLSTSDCGGGSANTILWPATQAQPGSLRLHDAGTAWSIFSTGPGTYDWTNLDRWLDNIQTHQPLDVIQVFSWVPCWDAPAPCVNPGVAPNGTNGPPNDLTPSGSPSFNDFVTQFVNHCSPAGNCAKTLIKFYEMWNEWDANNNGSLLRWGGTMTQLYNMVAPAVAIIRNNVPNAVILTPSTFSGGKIFGPAPADMVAWLNLETANGRLSDWVVWHDYLSGNTPETEWAKNPVNYVSAQLSLPAWASTPWANDETNFDPATFSCPSNFSSPDCAGQIVRWQLLHDSNGAGGLDWFKWLETIGQNSQYETAYYFMTQYMVGGQFSGPCTPASDAAIETWTCGFTEADGTAALFVWTPNEGGAAFSAPTGYVDYKDFTGATTSVSGPINIGVVPIMVEQ